MKELEKTKRISISAVLFLLVIAIAILTFKKPKHTFDKNTEATLKEIVSNNFILTLNEFNSKDASQFELIDIRSDFEYTKGHFNNAINIPTHLILEDVNINYFNDLESKNKIVVLYGKHLDEANSAWMLLYQLGFSNVKILSIETNYIDKQFEINDYTIEKPIANYAQIMLSEKLSSDYSKTQALEKKGAKSNPLRKVIPVKKKKKRVPEGGC